MKIFSFKQRLVIVAAAILLGLFLVRPGVSHLKARITSSISRAVGRPADIGSVHLRFLPRPGFDLQNLVIYEDSAFGAEPMLRAPEVTAVVRLTSLVRGRLDIARLELTEPSLNLVRRADARWNWEDLLERTGPHCWRPRQNREVRKRAQGFLTLPPLRAASISKTGAGKNAVRFAAECGFCLVARSRKIRGECV